MAGYRQMSGGAGRTLPAAFAVGVGLILMVLGPVLVWPTAFVGVVIGAACAGVYEMVHALHGVGVDAPLIPLLGGTLLMISWVRSGGEDSLIFGLGATIMAVAIWRFSEGVAEF